MKKAHEYTPQQHKTNNFGNNFITIECILSADYKNQTEEHFEKCLKEIPKLNDYLISRDKCDSEEHYEQAKAQAYLFLTLAMVERRIGLVK